MRRINAIFLGIAFGAVATHPGLAQTTPPVGQPAPTFSAPDERGETVKHEDYKGKYVVLAWFPKAFTAG